METTVKPVLIQRGISPTDNLEKLAREAQQLTLEKETQDLKSNNCLFNKKRKLWFEPNNNRLLLEALKSPLLTTVHALKPLVL